MTAMTKNGSLAIVRSSESLPRSDSAAVADLLLDRTRNPTPIRHRIAVGLAAGGGQVLSEATAVLLGRAPSDCDIVAYTPFLSTRAGCEQLLMNLFTSSSVLAGDDRPDWVEDVGELAAEGLVSLLVAQLEGPDPADPEDLFRIVLGREPSAVELAEANQRSEFGVQARQYVRWLASSREASMCNEDAWPPRLGSLALQLVDAVEHVG